MRFEDQDLDEERVRQMSARELYDANKKFGLRNPNSRPMRQRELLRFMRGHASDKQRPPGTRRTRAQVAASSDAVSYRPPRGCAVALAEIMHCISTTFGKVGGSFTPDMIKTIESVFKDAATMEVDERKDHFIRITSQRVDGASSKTLVDLQVEVATDKPDTAEQPRRILVFTFTPDAAHSDALPRIALTVRRPYADQAPPTADAAAVAVAAATAAHDGKRPKVLIEGLAVLPASDPALAQPDDEHLEQLAQLYTDFRTHLPVYERGELKSARKGREGKPMSDSEWQQTYLLPIFEHIKHQWVKGVGSVDKKTESTGGSGKSDSGGVSGKSDSGSVDKRGDHGAGSDLCQSHVEKKSEHGAATQQQQQPSKDKPKDRWRREDVVEATRCQIAWRTFIDFCIYSVDEILPRLAQRLDDEEKKQRVDKDTDADARVTHSHKGQHTKRKRVRSPQLDGAAADADEASAEEGREATTPNGKFSVDDGPVFAAATSTTTAMQHESESAGEKKQHSPRTRHTRTKCASKLNVDGRCHHLYGGAAADSTFIESVPSSENENAKKEHGLVGDDRNYSHDGNGVGALPKRRGLARKTVASASDSAAMDTSSSASDSFESREAATTDADMDMDADADASSESGLKRKVSGSSAENEQDDNTGPPTKRRRSARLDSTIPAVFAYNTEGERLDAILAALRAHPEVHMLWFAYGLVMVIVRW